MGAIEETAWRTSEEHDSSMIIELHVMDLIALAKIESFYDRVDMSHASLAGISEATS